MNSEFNGTGSASVDRVDGDSQIPSWETSDVGPVDMATERVLNTEEQPQHQAVDPQPEPTPEEVVNPEPVKPEPPASNVEVLNRINSLERTLVARLDNNDAEKERFKLIHDELQMYKRGEHFLRFKPIFHEIIKHYEELVRNASDPDRDESSRKLLIDLSEDVEGILESQGVTRILDEGDEVQRSIHKVIKAVPTSDPSLDRLIAQRTRNGFIYQESTIIQHIHVTVWKYDESLASAESVEATAPEEDAEANIELMAGELEKPAFSEADFDPNEVLEDDDDHNEA